MSKVPNVNYISPDPSTSSSTYHYKKKSGSTHNYAPEASTEESDRHASHFSKNPSHFDYANLGVFFGNRPGQKNLEAIYSKPHNKKKSSEAPYSNPIKDPITQVGAFKPTTMKESSSYEEFFTNPTFIPNLAENKTQPHVKKRSNDLTTAKTASEDLGEVFTPGSVEANVFRNHNKKKSREKDFSGLLKVQKEDLELFGDNGNKLGYEMAGEERERAGSTSTDRSSGKDGKNVKGNVKLMERIKSKNGSGRLSNNGGLDQGKGQADAFKTGNTGLFGGISTNKGTKGGNNMLFQYEDQENYGEDEGMHQNAFIDQLLEETGHAGKARSNIAGKDKDIPLDKSKEISQDDLNSRLLTEKTANKGVQGPVEIALDSSRGDYKKPNLSLINTDSTVDSENFVLPIDHHNNSFSTPYSGSFTHSGKLDFSSPVRGGSGRLHSESSEMNYMGGSFSIPRGMSMLDPRLSMLGGQRGQVDLNQSCMSYVGGYNNSSSNNSDHSGNISFTEEFFQGAFTNQYNTPQVRPQNMVRQIHQPQFQHHHQHQHQHQHPQQRYMPNQNFNMRSNPNMMEQFFIAPQDMSDPNFHRGPNFNMMQSNMGQPQLQVPGSLSNLDKSKSGPTDNKNPSRMRRKTQQAEEGGAYEIDLNRVDNDPRTTLMIRNIPNKYDLPLMMQTIDKNHKAKFDFFYLPIDFSNRCNFGYAFINFTNTAYIKDFYNEFHGKKWEKFNSEKICEIRYARIQGHSALMQHFQYSRVMNQQDKKLKPYIPPKYDLQNKQKLEQLVRQQKMESGKEVRQGEFRKQGYTGK